MTPLFLASVTSVEEARVAARGGADIIDCKDPGRGALGALPVASVRAIRASLPPRVDVSATIGDLPPDPATVVAAAEAMADSGCDLIKIGIFPGGDARATIAALGVSLGAHRPGAPALVGLLLADNRPDFALIPHLASAGFAGVMLDTGAKDGSSLFDHVRATALSHFIASARSAGLFAGLAGSLRLSHMPELLRLKPNVVGFRGALCAGGQRTGAVSADLVHAVRAGLGGGDRAACVATTEPASG